MEARRKNLSSREPEDPEAAETAERQIDLAQVSARKGLADSALTRSVPTRSALARSVLAGSVLIRFGRGLVRLWRAWLDMGVRRWRRRKWLWIGLAASGLGLAVLVWVAVYLWTTNYIDERIADLLAGAQAVGWQISYETIEGGGFPFFVSRRFIGLQAEQEDLFRLASPDPEMRLSIVRPSQARLLWSALHIQDVQFGVGGFDFATGESQLDLHQPPYEGTAEVVLVLRDFSVVPTTLVLPQAIPALRAKVLTASLRGAVPEEAHTLSFRFGAEGVTSATNTESERDFSLSGKLYGPLPQGLASLWLAAWRDSGGYLELDQVRFASGAATITARGSLTLDRENYPLGTGHFIFSGGAELLDSLDMSGQAEPTAPIETESESKQEAEAKQEAEPALELEFAWRAQNGTLYVNDIPLFRLRPLF